VADPGIGGTTTSGADPRGAIREEARRLGFDRVGFAEAGVHEHAGRLREWLRLGRHGTMRWMARDPARRADPRLALPGARTVISVAASYYRGGWPEAPGSEAPGSDAPTLRGRVARYAWGRDYHKRLKRRLHALAKVVLALRPDTRYAAYVDAGPTLDRGWAERAGVGWIGKNTNVILKDAGSWHFLGEIVTDLALAPDPPARNYCGTCSRCLTTCPTGAIVAPYQLDARRCISYLTIEHRGSIPIELRPAIGTRIFGCDDCQEVCPWNRFATPTANPDFAERPEQQTPELIALLSLGRPGFDARYRGTALRRAGRDRFARNAAVALGNLADPRAIPSLRRALLQDPDSVVRSHAAWALGRIGGPVAREALEASRRVEPDAEARLEIGYALETIQA
jgi:epoxyqueuosine reductase